MAILAVPPTNTRPLKGSIVSPQNMGAASQIGRLIFIDADGLCYETDATNANSVTGLIGLIVGTGQPYRASGIVAIEDRVSVLWFGRVYLGVTLNPDAQYFAANITSTVKGLIGDVAGSTSRRVGKPESTDGVFFFNPQEIATVS